MRDISTLGVGGFYAVVEIMLPFRPEMTRYPNSKQIYFKWQLLAFEIVATTILGSATKNFNIFGICYVCHCSPVAFTFFVAVVNNSFLAYASRSVSTVRELIF